MAAHAGRIVPLGFAAVVFFTAASALAAPESRARSEVKQLLAEAKQAYDRADFSGSAALYLEARALAEDHRLGGRAAMTFNAGLALLQAEDCDRALPLFREFAALDPEGAATEPARAQLEAAERCATPPPPEPAPPPAPAPPPEVPPPSEVPPPPEPVPPARAAALPAPLAAPAITPEPQSPWPWITGGAAVVFTVSAVIFHAAAAQSRSEAQAQIDRCLASGGAEAGCSTARLEDEASAIDRDRFLAYGQYALAAGLAGLTLWLLLDGSEDRAGVAIGPGTAGVVARW